MPTNPPISEPLKRVIEELSDRYKSGIYTPRCIVEDAVTTTAEALSSLPAGFGEAPMPYREGDLFIDGSGKEWRVTEDGELCRGGTTLHVEASALAYLGYSVLRPIPTPPETIEREGVIDLAGLGLICSDSQAAYDHASGVASINGRPVSYSWGGGFYLVQPDGEQTEVEPVSPQPLPWDRGLTEEELPELKPGMRFNWPGGDVRELLTVRCGRWGYWNEGAEVFGDYAPDKFIGHIPADLATAKMLGREVPA